MINYQQHKRWNYLTLILVCLLSISCLLNLTGCGMNGKLYLPDNDHPAPTKPDPNEPTWF